MFTDPTGDGAAQVRRVTLAKQQQLVAVKGSDQPTAPRLPAQTATVFVESAACRCPPDTTGSTSFWRIRQPLVCDRGLDSGLAIQRSGDWRRVEAEARLGQVFALPGQYASDDG